MNKTGFLKYKVLKFKKPFITESFFSEKIRTNKQDKLIKTIKQLGVNVSELNINWEYISEHDRLNTNFIEFFKDYIDFDLYSINKNLTIHKIKKFREYLNWNLLSKYYKFTIDDMIMFKNLLNWRYIYFYQNLTSKQIKDNFTRQMWWLFDNDKIDDDIDERYDIINDMVIHKNIRNIPDELIKKYDDKLSEYINNKIQLKKILKNNLTILLEEYHKDSKIEETYPVNIKIDKGNKEIEIQTEKNVKEIEIQTEKIKNENMNKGIQTEEEIQDLEIYDEGYTDDEYEEELENPFESDEYENEDNEEENVFEKYESESDLKKFLNECDDKIFYLIINFIKIE